MKCSQEVCVLSMFLFTLNIHLISLFICYSNLTLSFSSSCFRNWLFPSLSFLIYYFRYVFFIYVSILFYFIYLFNIFNQPLMSSLFLFFFFSFFLFFFFSFFLLRCECWTEEIPPGLGWSTHRNRTLGWIRRRVSSG